MSESRATMQSNEQFNDRAADHSGNAPAEEFSLLMSLALDDLLDEEESQRFDELLAKYSAFAEEWQSWQELDRSFKLTPSVAPPASFVHDVEMRLLQQERRRRLFWGIGLGTLVVLLCVGLIGGAVALSAYLLFNQAGLLTEVVRTLAYVSVSIQNWFDTVLAAASTLVGTPQARTFAVLYLVVAGMLLAGWLRLLRRSTRLVETASPA